MKGRTRWYPRHVHPARPGFYECAVRLCGMAPLVIWDLEWDGRGFLVPCPMVVRQWRGLTKKAHAEAVKAIPAGRT